MYPQVEPTSTMCVNTDRYPRRNSMTNGGPVKQRRFPRRHSMESRPPRPSQEVYVDTYEAHRVQEIMTNQQQRQLERARMRKNVSFDEVVMVRPVLPLEQYTDQEIISSWYLPIEKQRMKQEIAAIIKVVKKKNEKSGKKFNVRGLEWLATKDKSRERRRKASIIEILNEQRVQRNNCAHQMDFDLDNSDRSTMMTYDFESFRKVYRRHSRAALQMAYTMGKIDEQEAGIVPKEQQQAFNGDASMSSFNSSDSSGQLDMSARSNRSLSSRNSSHSRMSTHSRSSVTHLSSRKTRTGARRFSLGSSKNASWDNMIGGTVSVQQ
jgi:hypothetical protein